MKEWSLTPLADVRQKCFILDAPREMPVDDLYERLIRERVPKIPERIFTQFVLNATIIALINPNLRGVRSSQEIVPRVFRNPIESSPP